MIDVFCNLEEFEDGAKPWCDLTFEIAERSFDSGKACWVLSMTARHGQETVGFSARLPVQGWREQVNGEGDEAFRSYWGPVWLGSSGERSDRLLKLLDEYYGLATDSALTFVNEIECLAVGIMSDPARMAEEPTKMKLFFDNGEDEELYGEVFFNLDLPEGYVGLNEKDPEYRKPLVHWLSRHGRIVANPHAGETLQ
ncbi:hypothetical protein [Sphingomonas sp.]|uniref:hypothetical protein n=1 Tax=Sphingomonas sp. TaxID=28214 RepID=UPI002EDB735D